MPDFARLPLSFEPNAGQTDQRVRFMARASGGTLFFTPAEVVLTLPSVEPRFSAREHDLAAERDTSVLRLQFVGANPSASIIGGDALPGKVNYLVGSDPAKWRTDLPTYSDIAYSQLYRGVDLAYMGTGGQLKGTYTVAAGVDPTQIRWRYIGADRVSLDAQGSLQITLKSGMKLTEKAPVVWQDIGEQRVPVSAYYHIASDGTIGFQLGAYNKQYPLTIDPTLVYSTYLGGAAPDEAYGIALDAAGNMYIAGLTQSSNFPVQGGYQSTYQGGTDAFVTKLNPSGTALVYSTYLGGSGLEQGFAIDVDNEGNAIITGNTNSANFPVQAALQPNYGGGLVDSFATKLNQAGSNLVFSTYLGGSGFDTGQGVAVDGANNVFVAGLSNSTNFPIHNPYQGNNAGAQDVTLTSLSPTGGARFSTYLGGTGDDFGRGAAADDAGNVYVTGSTASNNFPVMNAYQPTCRNNCTYSDSFLTKFTGIGQLLYSTFLGGNIEEVGYGVAADANGNAYLTGTTTSLNFPTRNPFQPNFVNFIDAYASKINTTLSGDASLVYSTYLGGNSTDYGYDVEVDGAGNAYVTGYANSTNFPVQDPIQGTTAGGADAYVTVFAASGSSLIYSTYLGGDANDFGRGIALDGAGNTYIAGHTESTNFPTQNPYQANNAGARDAFIARIFQQPAATATPPVPTATATATLTAVIPTSTAVPPSATSLPPTATPTTTSIATATSIPVLTATNTVQPTPSTCAIIFTDLPSGHTFYANVRCLACNGIVSGYADGTFRPDNLVTRGQLAKIVSNAANFTEPPGTQIFQDVAPDHTFYEWINRLTNRGYMSGYTCGSPGEPCVQNRPYFRPFNNATRAQTSKIVANAARYNDPPTGQTFEDVPPTHPFYTEIQRLASRNIMGGYQCGGPGEPCILPLNRPYFRPYNDVTRGQSAKIVANTFYPDCHTP
jgi:hypothetical protein